MTSLDLFAHRGHQAYGVFESGGALYHEKCGGNLFTECMCYLDEWLCDDCGEMTFPFSGLKMDDGCVMCGGKNVRKPSYNEAMNWRQHMGVPW